MGGLGNQLFQLFATMAYAIETGQRFIFPYSTVVEVGKHRPTYWTTFLKTLLPFTTNNLKHGVTNENVDSYIQYNEPDFAYRPIRPLLNENVCLVGYFQSPLYFDSYKEVIFRMIRLRDMQREILSKYPEYAVDVVSSGRIVSIHFRLGDYKAIQDRHPVMPVTYYAEALKWLHQDTKEKEKDEANVVKVLYCCEEEDNDVVEEMIDQLAQLYPTLLFQKIMPKLSDWEQMLLMSCCHSNIIANSTFSWWSAYFNMHSDHQVCYPSTWFGPALHHNVSTLFPASWKKIEI